MKKIITTCILITFVFSQEGEIVNVQAAQRTDGSGIVDISYELLPDGTFPSFDVEAYALNMEPHLWYEFNESGGIDVYLNSGNQAVSGIYLQWSYYDWNDLGCAAFSVSSDVDFSSNSLFSDWEIDGYFYLNNGNDNFPNGHVSMYAPGLNMEQNTYNGSGEDVIPRGTEHLFLFTITDVNSELWTSYNCTHNGVHNFNYWTNSETSNWTAFNNLNDEKDSLYPLQLSSTAGIGENIFPGVYNFSYQLSDNIYHPSLKIRVIANAYIVDSELPFSMATIPSGTYFDVNGQEQTMDYSYEIMQYELTNEQLATWALTLEEHPCAAEDDSAGVILGINALYEAIAGGFEHINFDGSTIEIEPGYGNLSAVSSFNSNGYEEIIGCFSEYYGLRVPNVNEWLYAARGSEDVPFPWVDEWTCEDPDYLSSCGIGGGIYMCSTVLF